MLLLLEVNPSRLLINLYAVYGFSEEELAEDICRAAFCIDRHTEMSLFMCEISVMANHAGYDVQECIREAKSFFTTADSPQTRLLLNDKWRYFRILDETTAVLYKGNLTSRKVNDNGTLRQV